jgi:hypothetical protein
MSSNQYHSGLKQQQQQQHEVKVLGDKNGSPPSYNKTIGSLFYASNSGSVTSKASQPIPASLAPQYTSGSSLPQSKSLVGAVAANKLLTKKQIGLPKPVFLSRLPQNRPKK